MPLLEVKNLDVTYRVRNGRLRAVQGISFGLEKEDSLGIVGESACGKSTVALSLMRILPPNAEIEGGEIRFDGVDIARLPEEEMMKLRWSRISMIFQGAMNALNPVIKIQDQLAEPLKIHSSLSKSEIRPRVLEVFGLVGMPADRLNNYPHEFSGGMKQRVMIAMSLICNPALLIADEPTTALDVVVQLQILQQIKALQKKLGFALIMISHDLAVISGTCNVIAVMYGGKILEYGKTKDIIVNPRHPYTLGLMRSFPNLRGPLRQLKPIPGVPPNLRQQISGCNFKPRCPMAQDICAQTPPTVTISPGHISGCHFAEEIGGSRS